jgi:D-amino peptidase
MHAKAGTPDGLLSHTVSSSQWTNLSFNGVSVGESGINAALCGTWGCPVLLVTGDDAVCREARALLGDGLTTVAVKTALGRYSARHIPPARARQMIEDGATAALADLNAVAPYVLSSPVEITVEFATPDLVAKYHFLPGVEIVDGRTIVSRAADWWTAWRQFYFIG